MGKKLEIRLYEENDTSVSLGSMSASAVDSFVKVVTALKELALTTMSEESLIFSIKEGSALAAVQGNDSSMTVLYKDINEAISGKSQDKEVTKFLRVIQNELKREKFSYNFNFYDKKEKINLYEPIVNSSRITVQRKPKSEINYQLKIIGGFFNQIGGKDPNYHFDYGNGDKLTIDCSIEDAKKINRYLYTKVNSILISKNWNNSDKKEELAHKIVIDNDLLKPIKKFLKDYNKEDDLIEKLTITHDFIDEQFHSNPKKFEILNTLLVAFNSENFHLSELKTFLIISKPFKTHNLIKDNRSRLLETYNKMRNR